ncbi:MAG TPA: ankyrin repeat domain-containing protein [Candidatus Babeliales bacterium]|jgi:hypothetical protein|nr:ankyrin repeat domain-containing protein [Candidatus Babeliales bacterium]
MKKLYLLSGILVGFVVGVNAMEKECPEAFQMIDDLISKSSEENRHVDWASIFAVLDKFPDVITANDYFTPSEMPVSLLFIAVGEGDLLAAKTLLEKYKIDPNIRSLNGVITDPNLNLQRLKGMTALMMACLRYDLPMVKLLLDHGANPYLKNALNQSCFNFTQGNFEILEVLYQYTGSAGAA